MRDFIWIVLALVSFLAWVGFYIMYHVEDFSIHLLLIFALICAMIHLLREFKQP